MQKIVVFFNKKIEDKDAKYEKYQKARDQCHYR